MSLLKILSDPLIPELECKESCAWNVRINLFFLHFLKRGENCCSIWNLDHYFWGPTNTPDTLFVVQQETTLEGLRRGAIPICMPWKWAKGMKKLVFLEVYFLFHFCRFGGVLEGLFGKTYFIAKVPPLHISSGLGPHLFLMGTDLSPTLPQKTGGMWSLCPLCCRSCQEVTLYCNF